MCDVCVEDFVSTLRGNTVVVVSAVLVGGFEIVGILKVLVEVFASAARKQPEFDGIKVVGKGLVGVRMGCAVFDVLPDFFL